jgi:molybdopterin-guanine dinucleotide biosynthesis protein A
MSGDVAKISGFVLTGGRSSRMGRDKALLPFGGGLLGGRIAGVVASVCGSAMVVGDPALHAGLGCEVVADLHPGIGPLGGIEAALAASPTPWVLVTACDMPALSAEFLNQLFDELAALRTSGEEPDALLPIPPGGPANPLCGLYHQRLLPRVREAIASGDFKVTRALNGTRLALLPVDDGQPLRNANTPEEWDALLNELNTPELTHEH